MIPPHQMDTCFVLPKASCNNVATRKTLDFKLKVTVKVESQVESRVKVEELVPEGEERPCESILIPDETQTEFGLDCFRWGSLDFIP